MTIDPREFRNALGLFPTGVAIISTVSAHGERIGATVSSFNSVSLDPPLILFSIARNARAFDIWAEAPHYAVSVLSESQSETSNRFARASPDKWDGVPHVQGALGVPMIQGASACFECESFARHDGGDHLILVGRVTSYSVADATTPRPLLFYRGRYRQIEADVVIDTPQGVDYFVHGW
ncbi:flavin reductase family protein [Tardiphaga sp.]|uniref:flavin reductase family protein n=1 Tax=Tardiphaga sp. TaxID=1926292 RepID=UPI0025D70ED6|nr:flavin reductase family protein [Tardiphaga sp.]